MNNDVGIGYQQMISRVEEKTKAKVDEIFVFSGLNDWLKDNKGSTFARILADFKPMAERRFRSEYLKEELENRKGIILSEQTILQKKIGDLSGALKPWEGGELSWLFSPLSICIEWLLKAGLAVIPIISITLILDTRPFSDILNEPNYFIYIAIFAGVALVWLLSGSVYKWVVSVSSSRITQNYFSKSGLTIARHKSNNQPSNQSNNHSNNQPSNHSNNQPSNHSNNQQKSSRLSYFFGISQFSILLILICVIEAYIGYSIISYNFELQVYQAKLNATNKSDNKAVFDGNNPNQSTPQIGEKKTPLTEPKHNTFSLFLSASIFALTNLLFSVSKANRYNQIQKIKRKLDSTLKELKNLNREFRYCEKEIKNVKKELKKNKEDYDELLNENESGILSEIRLLSNQAYVNQPQPMKSSTYTAIELLKKGEEQNKNENFNQSGDPEHGSTLNNQSNNSTS